jgi:hypothetical protein
MHSATVKYDAGLAIAVDSLTDRRGYPVVLAVRHAARIRPAP